MHSTNSIRIATANVPLRSKVFTVRRIFLISLMIGALRAQTSQPAQDAPSAPAPHLTATFIDNPPSLELFDASCKVVATYPLLKEATTRLSFKKLRSEPVHITDPSGNLLYVLQTGDKTSRVNAFSLITGAAIASADVSPSATILTVNKDGGLLMAYGTGNALSKVKDRRVSALTVMDATTLQVKFSQRFGEMPSMLRYVPEMERMVVMDRASSTIWFVDPNAGEAAPIELGGLARGTIVSADGKRLLTLVRNMNKGGKKAVRGGALNQFDIATGHQLHTSEKLGDALQLVRMGGGDEYWVLMKDRMQRVTPNGDPDKATIAYADQDKELGRGLDGLPGPAMLVGKRIAIEVLHRDGTLAHKLALIDPKAGRVDSLTPVGRPGVRTGKAAKRWGIALALSAAMAAGGAAASAGSSPLNPPVMTPVFLPGSASQVSSMAVSLDQKSVFVMDAESDDVTIVASDGRQAAILPIKSNGSAQLWRPSQATYVYHVGKSAITVIDPATNQIANQIPYEKGVTARLISTRNEFALCGPASCDIWDASTAMKVRTIDRNRLDAYLAHADAPAAEEEDDDVSEAMPDPVPCQAAPQRPQRKR